MINIRFIVFVFLRFLGLFIASAALTSLLAYTMLNPSSNRLEQSLLISTTSTLLPSVIFFAFTFIGFPYHDCKKGEHVLLIMLSPDEAWWYCKYCKYHREFTIEEYRAITIPKRVRLYPDK